MKHVLPCIIGAVLVSSCMKARPIGDPNVTSRNRADIVEEARLDVVSDSLTLGQQLHVEGAFRVTSPSRIYDIVTLKIVEHNKDGEPVIANSANATAKQVAPGQYTYEGEIRAPRDPGSYELEASSFGFTVGTRHVTVNPSSAASP